MELEKRENMKKFNVLLVILMSMFIVGCSSTPKKETANVDINEIHEAVKAAYGDNYLATMPMEAETVEELMGVNQADTDELIAEMPLMSTHVDTYISVKAKEGKADAVEEALNAYRKFLVEVGFTYPMNIAKINASKVLRYDDYVFFVMLGAMNEDMDASEEDQVTFAQDQMKIAEDVIAGFFK